MTGLVRAEIPRFQVRSSRPSSRPDGSRACRRRSRRSSSHGPREFLQVKGRAHHLPLCAYLLVAAQEEASEPQRFLDLSEDRLDDLFPQAIATAPTTPSQPCVHLCGAKTALLPVPVDRAALSVVLSTGRDVATDSPPIQILQVALGPVPAVRRHLARLLAGVRLDRIEQLGKLCTVVLRLRRRRRHDDLMLVIHRDLAVVRLLEAVASLHDPTLRIGEVALRLRGWHPIPSLFLLLLRLRFQGLFRRSDSSQALLLVHHPLRQLVAAAVLAVL